MVPRKRRVCRHTIVPSARLSELWVAPSGASRHNVSPAANSRVATTILPWSGPDHLTSMPSMAAAAVAAAAWLSPPTQGDEMPYIRCPSLRTLRYRLGYPAFSTCAAGATQRERQLHCRAPPSHTAASERVPRSAAPPQYLSRSKGGPLGWHMRRFSICYL
eukprot:COSAG05_NODE_1194_length_5568_cov_26.075878_8_plen_161_part_00